MYTIYGRPNCGWCVRAKGLLSSNNVEYKYIDIYKYECKGIFGCNINYSMSIYYNK